jgi:hypothetical protein
MGRRGGRILVMVAVLELALAAGLWMFLGNLPYAGGGLLLTAVILGSTGVVLLVVGLLWMRGAVRKDRISATGVAGTGQIVGLTQTGMLVNNQPQVELDLLVTIPGRSPYRAKVKEVVPLVMLNRLQGTLPVRVDPAEPEVVVVQWDQPNIGLGAPAFDPSGSAIGAGAAAFGGGSTVGGGDAAGGPGSASDETLGQVAAAMAATGSGAAPVFGQAAQAGYSVEQLRAHLRANGIAGMARIDRLDDSGQTIGDERLFTMTTTVSIPDRPPFVTGPSAAMVPLEKVGRVAVGVALPVRIAPDNQDVVMFEWDRI